jgi:hypothetical protein
MLLWLDIKESKMTFVNELQAKFNALKDKAEGDLHALVLKLESVFDRVHQVEVSGVFKQAVLSDIHAAASHVEAIADTLRSDVDVATQAVDTADDAVDKAVS